jgi:hypothetical protein
LEDSGGFRFSGQLNTQTEHRSNLPQRADCTRFSQEIPVSKPKLSQKSERYRVRLAGRNYAHEMSRIEFLSLLHKGVIVINNKRDLRCADFHPRYRGWIEGGRLRHAAKEKPTPAPGWAAQSFTALVCFSLWMFDPKTVGLYQDWWRTGEGRAPTLAERMG